jgi:outer membrane protein OmpA-like peptidoglycan-associated protein
MRNRFLTLSAVAAFVPVLAIAQQRPAPTSPPANPPRPTTTTTTTTTTQQPAARPAAAPAQQPAARPTTTTTTTTTTQRTVAGPDRSQSWEITVQGGVFSVDKALGGFISRSTAPPQFLFGGRAAVARHVSEHLDIGVGLGFGTGSLSLNTIRPTADITWTSDINNDFQIIIPLGVGLDRLTGKSVPPSNTAPRATSTYGVHAGVGIRKFFSPGTALRIEGRMGYDHFTETQFSTAYNGEGLIGLSFFPNAGPPTDSDGDGVPDKKDRCPNTPHGAIVDANGCPRDSDHDGVYDGLDRCPNTPANTPVDQYGCPRDTDGDGVPDNLDKCPNTPRGTPVYPASDVARAGCPVDTDGDGVPDNLDRCPNTPHGVPVDANGCPRDSDGDGVNDAEDKCPNTPPNARPVYPSGHAQAGCPVDTDGDGVPDYLDRCPNTAAGTRVDANGCPIEADSDHDGVPDSRDRCPNTPAGRMVDENGCPYVELPAVGASLVLRNVNFVTNRANLTTSSQAPLRDLALSIRAILRRSPNARFQIDGYTDSRGSAANNRALSQRRAETVKAAMTTAGVPAGSLDAVGHGPDNPKAPNTTASGRAQNRRVEIKRLS